MSTASVVLRDISHTSNINLSSTTTNKQQQQHIVLSKRKPRRSNSADNGSKRPKIRQISTITTPHDWVQLRIVCSDMNDYLRWILVVPAGITLYNLHRIVHYCAKYNDESSSINHYFIVKNEKYGSGTTPSNATAFTTTTTTTTATTTAITTPVTTTTTTPLTTIATTTTNIATISLLEDKSKLITDRKTRFMQVIQSSTESFEYVYGMLKLTITVDAIKSADKQKMDWLPRLCIGSKGTLPPEECCNDINLIRQFKPRKTVNIDKINKVLMHERFGANQKTNKSTKRDGPSSLLCQSHQAQPHSAVALIYKRPIDGPTEESSSCYTDEDVF